MKTKICTLLTVIAVGLCLASCSAKEPEEGNVIVKPQNAGYSIEVPAQWKTEHTDGMISVYVPGDVSKANIVAYTFPHGLETPVDSASYWEIYKKQFDDTYSEMIVDDSKTKKTRLASSQAQHMFYTVQIGEEVFSCQTILDVYGENVYLLTLTQGAKNEKNESNYVDYTEKLEEIAASFRIG